MTIFVLNPLGFRKLNHSSEMQNDALMHRKGLEEICFIHWKLGNHLHNLQLVTTIK